MLQNNTIDRSRIWVVVPVFNNKDTVFNIASECRKRIQHVLVVDDGSTDVNVENLFSGTDITVLRHKRNLGKGMAIRTALRYLRDRDAEFMLTIDADGQHHPEDIERFIPLLKQDNSAIIVGSRDFNSPDIPGKSRFGRAFSNFWLHLETGRVIDDSQSGFRVYPVQYLSRMKVDGRYYDFEIEVLTRAAWSGLELSQVPIQVLYSPAASKASSFRPFLDNLRISLMHARLVGRRLLPFPYPELVKRASAESNVSFIAHPTKLLKGLLKENATPLGLAVSAGVGMFLGALPLISVHILIVIYITARLHLNKVIAVGVQNLCMPPFVPVACIELGHFMLYKRWLSDITWKTIFGEIPKRLWEWLLGSLILAPLLAMIVGAAVFFAARAVRKKPNMYAAK
jgi:glycosyltransferase involved in cell wall biosynthesis